ncbi:MAG: CBS domain-containing protein [Nanoarchaeota archaeon]|nr:CBS domain-containing protein [Nanoarchaeota archaeon]
METGIKVCDAMTKKPEVITPNIYLNEASKKMLIGGVGSLIVKENDKLVGMLTEKDIVKAISNNLNPSTTTVNNIMVKKIITIDPKKDLYEAILKMNKEDVRRMPVISSNNKLIGLLTMKDILKLSPVLYDLRIEKFKIKEEDEKISHLPSTCENCGSIAPLYPIKNRFLCTACKH